MSNIINNELGYSVFLEQKTDQNNEHLRYTLPRRVYKWVDDDSVTDCYNCSKQFGIFLRRHHCRFCGKIFCADCINYQAMIPNELLSEDSKKGTWNEYLSSYIYTRDKAKHKVCMGCFDLIQFITSVKKIIELFLILKLDIKNLKKAGLICKSWHNASNYILSIFREIQYKLPSDTYSDLEKQLLWNNYEYIHGHNKYLIHLLKICNSEEEYKKVFKILHKKKSISCWSMLCNRNCSPRLTSFDAINLLCYTFKTTHNQHLQILREKSLEYLACTDRELKCYIPLLVYYLRYDENNIISNFLISRCTTNFQLLNALYWELQLYPRDNFHKNAYSDIILKLQNIFKDKSHDNNFIKIIEGYSFYRVIEKVSKMICDDGKKYEEIKDSFKFKNDLTYPLNHNYKIKNIVLDKIKIKNSATKPIFIPCETNKNTIINLLYKKEGVRKDQIIINLIHLAEIIIRREEGIDLELTTYNILPTNSTSGMIEIIDSSETIYHIQEKLNSNILNYILENNDHLKIADVRSTFIKSLAGYSVITYLFGVGDRHLDNIMVTKTGKLFHIDFGYILGDDPVVNNPGIRITPEIIDAIGGLNSKYYQTFTDLCTKIYNCLRRNIDIFMNILTLLPHISDIKLSEKEIEDQLIKRFIPGENKIDATLHLVNQLEKQNYIDKIKDWCHYHSKEKTVSSAMNRFSYAVSTLIKTTQEN